MGHKRREERKRRHLSGEFADHPEAVKRLDKAFDELRSISRTKPKWQKPEHPIARRRRLREEELKAPRQI